MDDMKRGAAEDPDNWLELIDQIVAGISDDEIEARLQWTLAACAVRADPTLTIGEAIRIVPVDARTTEGIVHDD